VVVVLGQGGVVVVVLGQGGGLCGGGTGARWSSGYVGERVRIMRCFIGWG
jgi:hypothetical protein